MEVMRTRRIGLTALVAGAMALGVVVTSLGGTRSMQTVAGITSAPRVVGFWQDAKMAPTVGGGWTLWSNGTVVPVGGDGGAPFYGDLPALHVATWDIVGMVPTTDNRGYYLVGADGGVFAFGDARYLGSLPGIGITTRYLGSPVIGIELCNQVPRASAGPGYALVLADGGTYTFGGC